MHEHALEQRIELGEQWKKTKIPFNAPLALVKSFVTHKYNEKSNYSLFFCELKGKESGWLERDTLTTVKYHNKQHTHTHINENENINTTWYLLQYVPYSHILNGVSNWERIFIILSSHLICSCVFFLYSFWTIAAIVFAI